MNDQPSPNRYGARPDGRRRVRPIDVGHHRFHYGAYGLAASVRPSDPRLNRFRYGAYERDARIRPIEVEHHRFHFGVYRPVGR